jgi:hypothetical protein
MRGFAEILGNSASSHYVTAAIEAANSRGAEGVTYVVGDITNLAGADLGRFDFFLAAPQATRELVKSRIAAASWAGVSSCGTCPVPGSSRNSAPGMAVA